ncbi:MAG: TrkA family potassium uptake protein [Gammaproteobacteria bacterium]|jgi:trk system potassium uptake protein TrkA|uniref:potassium channel family protein n=1 Tax=Marinomonas sp. BSi20584 TaxID=1594462 RepID=UPI000C1DEB64|nr:TrkA family potassium uptake protein [Marinomonas sp. BSi20584]MBU2022781.1 TrkA family potassium uptake protein [Gammaproteobacteria bacterium]MBU2240773.1 TrkA family potassium uptake protein [Gammaproteobacteria bacterium]MBU2318240.1 TrkA family potassium uptake protein [Gammaproteobacteria bacterium]PJE55121.1 potassium transporter TrkA [Marinomonas sp. BSi20584]
MAHFTVIGLGRFGVSASMELIYLGHTVTGVDRDAKIAEKYVDDFTQVMICDSTDENALKELDLINSDAVLVAIGEDMESSLLCILALKKLGVKEIWVKASSRAHHTIVSKLGVARIIHPEEEMGVRVAQALNYPMVNDYLSIGHGLYVVEIHIKPQLDGRPLGDVLDPAKGKVDAVMVKREQETFLQLDKTFVLKEKDILLLCGPRSELKHIAPRLA